MKSSFGQLQTSVKYGSTAKSLEGLEALEGALLPSCQHWEAEHDLERHRRGERAVASTGLVGHIHEHGVAPASEPQSHAAAEVSAQTSNQEQQNRVAALAVKVQPVTGIVLAQGSHSKA